MTKDFKKPSVTASNFGQYGMGWMLGGIAIGLLAGLTMYALANKGEQPPANSTPAPLSATADSAQYAATTAPAAGTMTDTTPAMRDAPVEENREEAPGFSYHAVLPQLEVGIPVTVLEEQAAQAKAESAKAAKNKEKEKEPAKEKAETPAAKLGNANGFQLGSYKTQAQAASLQERLKKSGLNTRVESANVNGQTWFRVRLGPATSQEMLNKWQQTLTGMGISAMPIRM
ncbi:MAG: SPOR domain-containing protein [Gammaproteobacteria bacterium]|nr:SPOR domain-containing protein [Gammaproteobacteria bacterium]MBU1725070.1 SPOR domain-containing protein [Gammaproteobacteria bacterium]MBU2007208.1 SPOR domain-containing protein [Gammaproteobacteria bacterium]